MPTIQSLTVQASAVKIGDLIDDVLPSPLVVGGKTYIHNGHMVNAMKAGTSNIRYQTTGGVIVVKSNADVTIRREVPTEDEIAADKAEKDASMLALMLEDVEDSIRKSQIRVDNAVTELQTGSAYNLDSQGHYINKYLKAVAERDLWRQVERYVGRDLEDGLKVDYPMAIAEVAKEVKRNLLDDRWRGGSTSGTSNVAEATMRAVASGWLRSYSVVFMVKRFEERADA